MVNRGSYIEQTGVPNATYPSFVEMIPLVLVKSILKCFTIYGHGGHLGHVTSIFQINFYFHVPKSLHTKFG